MALTLLVEPFPSGHRFQTVAMIATVLASGRDVVLLTSRGATEDPAYAEFLGDVEIRVEEVFDGPHPSARVVAREVARWSRQQPVAVAAVLDADQLLKRWWLEAPRAFGLRRRPKVVFMLTRYPARLALTDWTGWRLRVPKAVLALAAMATGCLGRVAGFAGRDDFAPGWIVKRARDPALCTAHSRDRTELRRRHDLPSDRPIVGIFGGVSERKYPDLVWEAVQTASDTAVLLLAGPMSPGTAAWVDGLPADQRARVEVREGFLPDEELDELLASADVVALAMTNNGSSGIQGKALAADVPVVTAGSEVRAREAAATGGGWSTAFTAEAFATGIRRLLAGERPPPAAVPPATPEGYVHALIGPVRRGS